MGTTGDYSAERNDNIITLCRIQDDNRGPRPDHFCDFQGSARAYFHTISQYRSLNRDELPLPNQTPYFGGRGHGCCEYILEISMGRTMNLDITTTLHSAVIPTLGSIQRNNDNLWRTS